MLTKVFSSSNDQGTQGDSNGPHRPSGTGGLDEPQSRTRGPGLRSLPELQTSMRALVNERRELRLKLTPGNHIPAAGGPGGGGAAGASFNSPVAGWDSGVRGKRFRNSEPGGQIPFSHMSSPTSGSAGYGAPSGGAVVSPSESVLRGVDPIRILRTQQGGPLLRRGFGRSTAERVQSLPPSVNPDLVDSPRLPKKRPKVELDKPTMERSRNIFGCLLGHLQKAKSRLDEEKHSRSSELQREMEQQVKQRLELERRNLAELRRRELREAHMQSLKRIREIQCQVRRVESEILTLRLQKHFELLLPFISTETTPTIFWLPADPSPYTNKAHENSCRRVKDTMNALERRFFEECAQDDALLLTRLQNKYESGNVPFSHRSIGECRPETALSSGPDTVLNHTEIPSTNRRRLSEVSGQKKMGGPVEVHPDLERDDTSSEDCGEDDGEGGSDRDETSEEETSPPVGLTVIENEEHGHES